MSYDVVTFGEAMIRMRPERGLRLEQADKLEITIGGGELNVAVGCSNLGLRSAWISRLPENPLGRLIRNKGREFGVCMRHVAWSAVDRAGLYFVEEGASPRAQTVLYDRAGSAISQIEPGQIAWQEAFARTRFFHVSGITPALSARAAEVTMEALKAAKACGCTVTYDLNYRSKLWTPAEAQRCQEALMPYVDLLITTEEDTKVVFGIEGHTGDDEHFKDVHFEGYRDVALKLVDKFKFKGVAITLRENKSVWFNTWSGLYYDATSKNFYDAPRYELEIVDRVGAGDSFAAGLLTALAIKPGDYDHAIRFAVATSALKHTIPGDFCIATRKEVEALMKGGGLRIVR